MTNSDGAALAAAWKAWCESTEGKKCLDPGILLPGQHKYLESRLWRAFMDGAVIRPPGASEMREAAELLAAAQAHRVCCGSEHDPASGKLHGYCVVCGVPWPCDSAKRFLPALPAPEVPEAVRDWVSVHRQNAYIDNTHSVDDGLYEWIKERFKI